MDEDALKLIAKHLQKPEGEIGKQTGVKMNAGNKLMNQASIEQLQVSPHDRVLEIGMGNGFFVKDILSIDPSISYAGCDFSDIMIVEAEKMNQEYIEKGQAQFFLTNADKLPFMDGTFNKIVTVNTIYFWKNPEEVLAEFKRVLQPNGKLIIGLRPKSQMKNYPFVKYDFNLFSKEEVAELLSKNDFDVTSILEKEEPDQEINGKKVKVAFMVVCAERIK
jgi:ubiquinone/menaquinone biosynthesis C-methylase UbiE